MLKAMLPSEAQFIKGINSLSSSIYPETGCTLLLLDCLDGDFDGFTELFLEGCKSGLFLFEGFF